MSSTLLIYLMGKLGPEEGRMPPEALQSTETTFEVAPRNPTLSGPISKTDHFSELCFFSVNVPTLDTAPYPFLFVLILFFCPLAPELCLTKRFVKSNSNPTEEPISGKALNRMRTEAFHSCLSSSPAELQAQYRCCVCMCVY